MNEEMRRPRPRRRRARLSPLTVLGELLILSGLAVFGYIVWQPWHTGVQVTAKQEQLSAEVAQAWNEAPPKEYAGKIPVATADGVGEVFGLLRVPAFGEGNVNKVGEGVGQWETLNLDTIGIGHYPDTALPGQPGNVAVAAHRSGGYITPFKEVMNLRVGDPLFFETEDGWYTYRFRSIEYVTPDQGEVLWAFPHLEGTPGDDQILTLTTCHPKSWGTLERAIAYSVFDSFQPRSDGPPAELLELDPNLAKKAA